MTKVHWNASALTGYVERGDLRGWERVPLDRRGCLVHWGRGGTPEVLHDMYILAWKLHGVKGLGGEVMWPF